MMRLWANSYAKSTPVMTSATLSVVAHTVDWQPSIAALQNSPQASATSSSDCGYSTPPSTAAKLVATLGKERVTEMSPSGR